MTRSTLVPAISIDVISQHRNPTMKCLEKVTTPYRLWIAIVLLMCSSAHAQQPRGAGLGRERMTLFGLLEREAVQRELKLSPQQIEAVAALAEKQGGHGGGLRKLSPEARLARIEQRIRENEAALAGVLSADQMARLKQISLQVRGALALGDSAVATALSLTDDQREKLGAIIEEARRERRTFDSKDAKTSREKIDAARASATAKALGILTEEQSAKWKEMIGAPFAVE